MVKGTGKKCSNRGDNKHNSRGCNGKGTYIKLFGVYIEVEDQSQESSIQRSFSMGHLQFHAENDNIKRGEPWTEEEHGMFLEGLSNVRKGDWRRISKNYVTSRTPVQVASHAPKKFLRRTGYDKKKRRRSLFDMRFRQSESKSAEVTPNMTQPLSFVQTMNNASTSHGASAPVDQPPPRSVQDDMSRLSSKFQCFFINGERSFGAQDFSP